MASGQMLAQCFPAGNEPPSSGAAVPDVRNGHPIMTFADGATESAIFTCFMPLNYSGNGITVLLDACYNATSGNVVWNVSIERIDAGTLDIDADSFASAQAATQAAPGTNGVTALTSIPFTNGSQMDSVAAGELFRIKVTRLGSDGSDSCTGAAQLLAVYIKET